MQSEAQSRTCYYFKLSHLPCQWTSNQPWRDWLPAAQQAGRAGRTEDTETTQRQKTAVHSQFTSMVQDLSYQAIRRCVWSMVYILESDLHTPNTARQKTRGVSAPMAKILAFCFAALLGPLCLFMSSKFSANTVSESETNTQNTSCRKPCRGGLEMQYRGEAGMLQARRLLT